MKLVKVDFGNADLHEARLIGANLLGADLSGSDLRGADLRGVTLDREALENDSSAIVVFPGEAIRAKLIEAKYDIHTKWPAGYDPSTAGAVLVDEDGIPASSKDGG